MRVTEVTTAQRCDREIYHSCVNHLKFNFFSFIMTDHNQCIYTPLDEDISLVVSVTPIKFFFEHTDLVTHLQILCDKVVTITF